MTASLSGRNGHDHDMAPLALADGTVVAVRDLGPRDAGTTVVLHHGWTQDHTSWEDVAQLLAEDHRVISYDARGHGRSDAGPHGSATIDQFADDLAEVITLLAPEGPLVLAGHSLGGPVLLAFAERHPALLTDRVAGLALVATGAAHLGSDIMGLPGVVTGPLVRVLPRALALPARLRIPRTRMQPLISQAIRTGLYGPGAASAVARRRTAAQVARSHPGTIAALAGNIVGRSWLHAMEALADVSTVILGGTHDLLTPIAHSHTMAEALPTATLVVYKGAGHMLPYERTSEVAAEIAALASPAAGRATS